VSVASLRRAKEMLEKALEDLHILGRAGVDTGQPQRLISDAIDIIDEHTGDDK